MLLPASVKIVEVGPRDGLQNESCSVSTAQKVAFIEALAVAGNQTIECGSFVSPSRVPAMADSADVFHQLHRRPGISYTALVPNVKGLKLAMDAGVTEVAVFASASESFSQHNINCSIAHSLDRYRDVLALARQSSLKVRGYVSCVAGCPYEGDVPAAAVQRVSEALLAMGCYEISLGDTIGVGVPNQIEALLESILKHVPVDKLAVHFHDTWGQALANILVALQLGVNVIDSSAAGLGGCPYAPGAAGNVATEDVLYMLHGMKIETGIDLEQVAAAGSEICRILKRPPASKAHRAWMRATREQPAKSWAGEVDT